MTSTIYPHRTVVVCLDTTSSYPHQYTQEALTAIAGAIYNAVLPGGQGLTVFIDPVTHNSLAGTLVPIIIPAIPADKQEPSYTPTPTEAPNENPAAYQATVGATDDANQQLHDSWQTFLAANHATWHAVQAQVKTQTDALAKKQFPIDNTGTDLLSCLQNASEYFAHEPGVHILLIVSDLQENEWYSGENISMSGAHVLMLWRYEDDPSVTNYYDNFFKQLFIQAGVHPKDINIYNRADSLALQGNFLNFTS